MEERLLLEMEREIKAWLQNQGTPADLAKALLMVIRDHRTKKEIISEEFVKEFQEIFPSQKLPTGKNFRSNIPDLTAKLKYFVKVYDYDPQTILEAARRYVEHAHQVRFNYVRTAAYFVYKKGEGSDLADWCDKCLNENLESPSTSLHTLL